MKWVLLFLFALSGLCEPLQVVCSTFPVYQITKNVVSDVEAIDLGLLVPASVGCEHDFVLSPSDRRRLGRADVLVINGLGLESFLKQAILRNVKVIDPSVGLELPKLPESDADRTYHGHGHGQSHTHGVNPHVLALPEFSGAYARNIATKLSEYRPESTLQFFANAQRYEQRMQQLTGALLKVSAASIPVVAPDGEWDYLLYRLGVKVVGRTPHGGENLSAAQLRTLLRILKAKEPKLILIGEEERRLRAKLQRATDASFVVLESIVAGSMDDPLDLYDTTMKRNLAAIQKVVGGN